MQPVAFLRKISIFNDLNDEQLTHVSSIIAIRKYRKKMFLFTEGEPGEAVYFVKSGLVKMAKTMEDGREQILHLMGPGDILGEVVLFDEGSYPATAEVMEDAEVCYIRNDDLEELLKRHGEIAISLIRVLSRRLQDAQRKVRDFALKDAYARTASILLGLANNSPVGADGIEVKPDLGRQELANMIGTSRETVSRILSDFQQQKILMVDRNKIVIINKDKLASWV